MDKKITNREKRLIRLLSEGGRYSVIEIAIRLHIGDPRSNIRHLRSKGIEILDEWVSTKDGVGRYKRYYMTFAAASTALKPESL